MKQQGIIILPKKVASIKEMRRLAYKRIFEKLNYEEEQLLEHSIEWWPKKENLTKLETGSLESIITLLIMNEEGKLNEMKEKVKKFNLNYKLIYGVF